MDGACREAAEEADVPRDALTPLATVEVDRAVWRYTTVVAETRTPFEARAVDAESHELRWVSLAEVDALPLHPGFAAAWPLHRRLLSVRRTLVVDLANVMGSVPDGWWKDRHRAATRWIARLSTIANEGVDAHIWNAAVGNRDHDPAGDSSLDSQGRTDLTTRVVPRVIAVVEGQARGARGHGAERGGADGDSADRHSADRHSAGLGGLAVEVVDAPGPGDDTVAEVAATHATARRGQLTTEVLTISSDRELRARVEATGAHSVGSGWLRDVLR